MRYLTCGTWNACPLQKARSINLLRYLDVVARGGGGRMQSRRSPVTRDRHLNSVTWCLEDWRARVGHWETVFLGSSCICPKFAPQPPRRGVVERPSRADQ